MRNWKNWIRPGLLVMSALALLRPQTILQAHQTPPPPEKPAHLAPRESIQGKVSAKTGSSLTVDGKVITTTAGTAFTKNGKPITLLDVQVGDKVKVTAAKEADGTWQAIAVEVLETPPKAGG